MQKAGGFTLVELLLVMVILGVIFSLAAINLPGSREARLASEATRLLKLLDALQYEALLQRRPVGLQIDPQGYQALVFDPLSLEWVNGNRRLFIRHDLEARGLRLRSDGASSAMTEHRPAFWFDATGISRPFTLDLAYAEGRPDTRRLSSNGLGEILVE